VPALLCRDSRNGEPACCEGNYYCRLTAKAQRNKTDLDDCRHAAAYYWKKPQAQERLR